MKEIFKFGDKLKITSTKNYGICFSNNVGGTENYPMNQPINVTVIKEWHDYEIGQRYVAVAENGIRYFFGDSGIKIEQIEKTLNEIPEDIFRQFLSMACDLSPENLSCDGEISNAEANKKYRVIMKKWHKLEKELGRKITENEVWEIHIKKWNAKEIKRKL